MSDVKVFRRERYFTDVRITRRYLQVSKTCTHVYLYARLLVRTCTRTRAGIRSIHVTASINGERGLPDTGDDVSSCGSNDGVTALA